MSTRSTRADPPRGAGTRANDRRDSQSRRGIGRRRSDGPMGAAEGLAEWRKRQRALSWLPRLLGRWRRGGAITVFGKVPGKALPRQRRLRGREGSRGFALCAFLLRFPPRARRPPEPRTRCALPGSAAGRVAALLRVGGGTGDGRGLSGLWRSLPHHP